MSSGFGVYDFAEGPAVQIAGREVEGSAGSRVVESAGYQLDYQFEGNTIPTPATMERLASEHDLPIEVVREATDQGIIPVEAYLEAFRRGKYPVGAGDLEAYAHDVRSNDHIVGVIVLGSEGLESLAPIASAALDSEEHQGNVAGFYDGITNGISSIITSPDNWEMFGPEEEKGQHFERVADNLLSAVQQAETQARVVGAEFDGAAFMDLVKKNIVSLHEELDFGENFSQFLEVLLLKEYEAPPEPEVADDFELVG